MSRPPLDLGAMKAPSLEINIQRMRDLVDTFNTLLKKNIKLEDTAIGGHTDCENYIRVPLADPEAYLICEHELSHIFAETDLPLMAAFKEKAVERLLTRARIASTSTTGRALSRPLGDMFQGLWNILEDWRCKSIWGELYYGGATLLGERWKGIAEHEGEEAAKISLCAYLGRVAAGFDTADAPNHFQVCKPAMDRARAQVELVDAHACLAITARLVDDIADQILQEMPPPEPPKTGQQKAEQVLQALKDVAQQFTPPSDGLGKKEESLPKKQPSAATMQKIRRLITANDEDADENGETSFSKLCKDGTEKMNARIAAAKAELGKQAKNEEDEEETDLIQAGRDCKVIVRLVTPEHPPEKPSRSAEGVRRYLDEIRAEQELSTARFGPRLNIQKAIQARVGGNLSSIPVFQKVTEHKGLELLIVVDVSGSMVGFPLDSVNQAVADVAHACKDLNVSLNLWAFSEVIYPFTKIGSLNSDSINNGSTHLIGALDMASEWAKNKKSARAILLMTDGYPSYFRGRNSTGDALKDLSNVIREIRGEGIVLSILAIGDRKDVYDKLFGARQYALITNPEDITAGVVNSARLIVEAHLRR
jgi:hypothetical protein